MQKYWFFDSALMRAAANVRAVPGNAVKRAENWLFSEGLYDTPSLPWEPRFDNGYPNVFFDPLLGKYRCYYTSFIRDDVSAATPPERRAGMRYKTDGTRVVGLLYAESADGLCWEKPPLGVTPWMGTRRNNIVMAHAHGASVLLDPEEKDPARRYKMLMRMDAPEKKLCAAFSADGVRFSTPEPLRFDGDAPGDTHNFVLRDAAAGGYALYTRMFTRELRTVGRMHSEDFLHWSAPREVFCGQGADDQIYAMPVFRQEGLYFGLAAVFYVGDRDRPHHDHVEVELAFSGDGLRWQRVAPGRPLIANGPDAYDAGCCFASPPVREGDDYRLYYMGGNGTHYAFRQTGLCLATLPAAKLAGITAEDAGRPFVFQTARLLAAGGEWQVCADVGAGGGITYALLDAAGEPLPGFDEARCAPITASCLRAPLRWADAPPVPEAPVMLRFTGRNATLYSLSGAFALRPTHPL